MMDITPTSYPQAACRGEDPELFFPERPVGMQTPEKRGEYAIQVATARSICGRCPHQAQCLEDNLGVQYGIYGGMSESQRDRERRRRGRKRTVLSGATFETLARQAREERAIQAKTA